jgi:hypothetical protein
MTPEATQVEQIDQNDHSKFIKAVLCLKAAILEYSTKHGMKWSPARPPSPEYEAFRKQWFITGYYWYAPMNWCPTNASITSLHCLYAQLRHPSRPHLATQELDWKMAKGARTTVKRILGFDLEEVGYEW